MKKLFLFSIFTAALLCLSSCNEKSTVETTTATMTSSASETSTSSITTETVTTTASATKATTSVTSTTDTTPVTTPSFTHVDDIEPSFRNLIFEQYFMADWTFVEGFGYNERVEFSYNNDYYDGDVSYCKGFYSDKNGYYMLGFGGGVNHLYYIPASDTDTMYYCDDISILPTEDNILFTDRYRKENDNESYMYGNLGYIGYEKYMHKQGNKFREAVEKLFKEGFTDENSNEYIGLNIGAYGADYGDFIVPYSDNNRVIMRMFSRAALDEVEGIPEEKDSQYFEFTFDKKDGEWVVSEYRKVYRFEPVSADSQLSLSEQLEIVEEYFYGDWEYAGELYNYSTDSLTFRYDECCFYYGWLSFRSAYKVNDGYVIEYINGGVLECYFIPEDNTDILYSCMYDFIIDGIYADSSSSFKRVSNSEPVLETGEISALGFIKLCAELGEDFSDCFNQIMPPYYLYTDENGNTFTTERSMVFEAEKRYLVSLEENKVQLAVLFYDKDEYDASTDDPSVPDPTEYYFTLTFEKDNGEWSLISTEPYEVQ